MIPMTYLHTAPTAPSYDEEELPICQTMDQLQHFYNTGSRFADKPADDDDDDEAPTGPAWDSTKEARDDQG